MSFSIHEQIRSKLRERLLALPEGIRFATEKELCAEFGVSRMTVNKVVSELSTSGYLRRERLKGSFVSRPAGERPLVKFLLSAPDDIFSQVCGSVRGRLLFAGAVAAASRLGARVESVKSVAYELGYTNPLYFSSEFHRIVGCSPTEFRRR